MTNSNNINSSFTDFLNKNKDALTKNKFPHALISFKIPDCNFQLENKLSSIIHNYSKVFCFENVEKNFLMIGIGSALEISENGLRRFSSLTKKINELKMKIISNWKETENEFPLILGGMKFTVEHSEDEWENFKDSDWFIPELLFIQSNGKQHLFFNFVNQNSLLNKIIGRFSAVLNEVQNLTETTTQKAVKVLSSSGQSPKDKKKWKLLAQDSLSRLPQLGIEKIVLSRRVELTLSEHPNWNAVRNYFAENYQSSSIFFYHKNNSTFFGASPEQLIKFQDRKISVDVLAGSISRGENLTDDKMFEEQMQLSTKLNTEHDLVTHQIKKSLSKYITKIHTHKMPLKKLKNIQHLHTILESELLPETQVFELIESIFPTAAICGEPKDKSLSLIKKLENYKRGLYSGIIGYFSPFDTGEFVIGIRSALFHQNKLYAYAGCGLIDGSDADAEFEETEMKLNTILNFFNEQNKSK